MAEITPTPRAGSRVVSPGPSTPADEPPRAGTRARLTHAPPPIRAGARVVMTFTPPDGKKRGFYVGLPIG